MFSLLNTILYLLQTRISTRGNLSRYTEGSKSDQNHRDLQSRGAAVCGSGAFRSGGLAPISAAPEPGGRGGNFYT